jgi:hypothetical protein
MYSAYGPGTTEQPFDPTVPVEATVSAQITLTFAMGAASEATSDAPNQEPDGVVEYEYDPYHIEGDIDYSALPEY